MSNEALHARAPDLTPWIWHLGARPAGDDAAPLEATTADEAAYEWDIASDELTWSDNARHVLNVGACDVVATGRRYAELLAPRCEGSRYGAVFDAGGFDHGDGVPFQVTYALRARSGGVTWLEDTGRWFGSADGSVSHVRGAVRDVTAEHEERHRLAHLSRIDEATGALTYVALLDTVARLLAAENDQRPGFALFVVSVDADTAAQTRGISERDLARVVDCLRRHVRSGDLIARCGPTRLAIVLHGCGAEHMEVAAKRLFDAASALSVQSPAGPWRVQLRFGGVARSSLLRDPQTIVQRAAAALEDAGRDAAKPFDAYDPRRERGGGRGAARLSADDVVAALNARRVFLAYQPIVARRPGAPPLYEALVRILHEDGSVVAPGDLMTGGRVDVLKLLDHRVLELALLRLAQQPSLTLTINVSASTALDPEWPARIAHALALYAGCANRLIVEFGEAGMTEKPGIARAVVAAVRDLGVRIALGGFGVGHASLRVLRDLHVDLLKIDGAFTRNLAASGEDRSFVRALIRQARSLGVAVVAERVEDAASASLLQNWGVDYLQGHYFGEAATLPEA